MQDALYVTHGSKPQAAAKASVITKNLLQRCSTKICIIQISNTATISHTMLKVKGKYL